MTTRVQTLRSSNTGAVPAAGTRTPGELWTNFPDLQLGVIDASKNAQKLVAVRYFSTTANYAVGDFVIQAGVLYVAKSAVTAGAFNATQWTQIAASTDANGPYLAIAGGTLTGALVLAADPGAALGAATKQYVDGKVTAAPFLPLAGGTLTGPVVLSGPPTIPLHAATKAYVDSGAFLPLAGGTMTGPIVLAADPAAALQPATKQYVDAKPAAMNDNRIINGDMRIDQRNNGSSGTTVGYTCDRWSYYGSQPSKISWLRSSTSGLAGFPYYLNIISSSSYASLAADLFNLSQAIEADMVSDFAWGSASAQPVTLSFWVYCTKTGTFSGSVQNYAGTRSYPFSYSIPAASTWTKIALTIPGDTAGTWVMLGNAGSVTLNFDLGSGGNWRGAAGAWAAANYVGVTGSGSVVATNAAQFGVTGVKLEIGSIATPYNRQSLAKSLADCQRYYQIGTVQTAMYGQTSWAVTVSLVNSMRASSTTTSNFSGQSNCTSSVIQAFDNSNLQHQGNVTAPGPYNSYGTYTASAEL